MLMLPVWDATAPGGACRLYYKCCTGIWPCLQVADCQVKLQRADKLIGGLSGERSRWSATVEQLQQDLDNLVGDVVLAAGGRPPPPPKKELIAAWRLLCHLQCNKLQLHAAAGCLQCCKQ
jgi:hypothetical protein